MFVQDEIMIGMKMTYNTELEGSGSGRLISVEMWNKDREVYGACSSDLLICLT